MELAIPLIALGGLYVIASKHNKQEEDDNGKGTEGFQLPNVKRIPDNYKNAPIVIPSDSDYLPSQRQDVNEYANLQAYSDSVNTGRSSDNFMRSLYDVEGNYDQNDEYKHANMHPFSGGKVRGHVHDLDAYESRLDSMTGSGSQYNHKKEQAPLFSPANDTQYTHGAPNNSDFIRSRIVPSNTYNNVKPFDTIQVGPGLNQPGGIAGSGGFNSGAECRDLYMPKTVDELRVKTNPKMEYTLDGFEGPAISSIKNISTVESIGQFDKKLPDRYFENTPDRWLVTGGQQHGETQRAIYNQPSNVHRNTSETMYQGPLGNTVQQCMAPQNYQPSHRPDKTESMFSGIVGGIGKGGSAIDSEFIAKGYTHITPNNRATTTTSTFGGLGGLVSAMMAPVMDAIRPTRKDNGLINGRVFGDASASVPRSYGARGRDDILPPTIKETTLYEPRTYINRQDGAYINTQVAPDQNQRNMTNAEYYSAANASNYGHLDQTAAAHQTTNGIRYQTIGNRANQGGTQMFNAQMNVTTMRQDITGHDGRLNPAYKKMATPSNLYGQIKPPDRIVSQMTEMNAQRIDPQLLDAFKANPFTHPLNSY